MSPSLLSLTALAASLLSSIVSAQSVNGASYNYPSAGPPSSFFTAAPTINVQALKTAAAEATGVPNSAVYPVNNNGDSPTATIHDDWMNFPTGAAIVFVADMDVDCDGIDYKCQGNQDGQSQTDNGALAAYEVPWVVVPEEFQEAYPDLLPGNNVAAVICDNQMFYGIYGDSDGDDPEVIGEASWLMARTCFPTEGLTGGNGHGPVDVTYIVFVGEDSILPSSALNNNYITNFTTLRSMGNNLINALSTNLKISPTSSRRRSDE